MLDLIRILRRRERFQLAVEEEVALMHRRDGDDAYARTVEKLSRSNLTTRYRKVLERVAIALRH